MSKEEIAKRILIDEDALFERLVEKAGGIFRLDNKGNIVWIIPRDKLTDKEKISCVLLARHLASEIGIVDSQAVANSTVAEILNMSSESVGARMAELRDLGIAHSESRGHHRVILHGVDKMIEELSNRMDLPC